MKFSSERYPSGTTNPLNFVIETFNLFECTYGWTLTSCQRTYF